MKNYLNFETEIKDLENEIENLKDPYNNKEGLSEVDTQKITKTEEELNLKLKEIYSNLDPWQTTMVARHEDRPKSKFFIENLFTDFISFSDGVYNMESSHSFEHNLSSSITCIKVQKSFHFGNTRS